MHPLLKPCSFCCSGDYVIIEWVDQITKVQGDILHILYTDQIRHLKQNNMWYVGPGLRRHNGNAPCAHDVARDQWLKRIGRTISSP